MKNRTYIFIKTERDDHGKLVDYIAGMTQTDAFPSAEIRDSESPFYGARVEEVTDRCHIRLGRYAE